jgi:hypothetical protein
MNVQRTPAIRPDDWSHAFEDRMRDQIDRHERQLAEVGVLLWSQSQNAFHVERVQDMMRSNRSAYSDDRRMDYVPIFMGERSSCFDLAEKLRNTVKARAEARIEQAAQLQTIDRQQVIYALERGGRALIAQADAMAAQDRSDYSSEFPFEDAQRMREAIALLRPDARTSFEPL